MIARAAPTVSVVMAAYNGAALIEETLASLSSQTFQDFELLVVDDCSTDATREIVAAWPDSRIRLIALEANGGPVRARNRAVAEARGRYIAALDQDDLCHRERLARQVAYLDANPGVALVGSAADVLTERGTVVRGPAPQLTTPALLGWLLRIGNPLVWSSVMLRAEAARALDPFTRPELLYAEDFDLYHRIAAFGAVARIDTALLTYRRHAGGCSQRYEATMLASAMRVLTEAHEPGFGLVAGEVAGLFVTHLMHGAPVPDAATLARLGIAMAEAQAAYVAAVRPSAADRALIADAADARLRLAARTALRAGTIHAAAARTLAPIGLVRPHLDRLVGRVRQTLAA